MENCKYCRHPIEHHAKWCVHSRGNGRVAPEKIAVETWEEETLRLLNENELGEALKMFRQHHRMVNRWVCMDCGFTSPIIHSKGCAKCESDKIESRVVVDHQERRAK